MLLITLNPTLTGVALGGSIVRPDILMLMFAGLAPSLRLTMRIVPAIAPPIPDLQPAPPTLLTQVLVSPATG